MAEAVTVFGRMALWLLLFYGLLSVGVHFYARGMMFPQPPVRYQLTPEYIRLTAPDGVKLAARLWANPEAKYTVLYLHGNFEDLGSVGDYIPKFVAAGYAVFAFDYRRYGQSEGEPTEANLGADACAAFDYLREQLHVPPERIIVFGYSLGSGPAVDLALARHPAALVLQCAFVSAYRVVTGIPLFLGDKFRNLAKIGDVRCPVLVIHGRSDNTVPFWHGEALYAAAPAHKAKLFIDGGPHSGLEDYAGPRYWAELKRFIDSL